MFVSNKKIHIIAIVLVALVIIGSAFYLLSQDKPQTPTEQEPTVQQEEQSAPLQETPIQELPTLSEEDLAGLWLGSERCPKKGFYIIAPNVDDLIGDLYYDRKIGIIFTPDTACEDIERYAVSLDAKIYGFHKALNFYLFELPTLTAEETKTELNQLGDQKIDYVFRVDSDTSRNFFWFQRDSTSTVSTIVEMPILPEISLLSQEELTKFWANGKRCPEESFFVSVKVVSESKDYGEPYLNLIQLTFNGNETCEDLERIAALLNAKIYNFEPEYHYAQFQLPTETLEDLEKTMLKFQKLDHPKIDSIWINYRVDYRE